MNQPRLLRYSFTRGDRFRLPITFNRDVSGFVWENVTIQAQLKTEGGVLVHDFNPTPTIDGTTVSLTLAATSATTENWQTGALVMDIEIGADGFGPETPIKILLTVNPDVSF